MEQDYEKLKDWANSNTPFMRHSEFEITEITPDSAVVECNVKKIHLNPYSITHGGLLFSMADVASGTAARADGRKYVTEQASVSFLKPGKEGDLIKAEAKIIHRGRKSAVLDAEVRNQDGKLLFKGMFTYFCLDD
jgi:acyl-CoA thioesterase